MKTIIYIISLALLIFVSNPTIAQAPPTVRVTNTTECTQYLSPIISLSPLCILQLVYLGVDDIIEVSPGSYHDFTSNSLPFPFTNLFYIVGFEVFDGASGDYQVGMVKANSSCGYLPEQDWPLQPCDEEFGVAIEYVGGTSVQMYID